MQSSCPLLEFKNVTVVKGDNKKVLDSISLTVHAGENVVLLGPNGAGKSSFLKTLTREYYPIPGTKDFVFKVLGQSNWNIFDLRFLLGIVSNDLQYIFRRDITGREVVLSGFFSSVGLPLLHGAQDRHLTAKMKRKASEVIDFLELTHLKKRNISEMSSGEARRFLIGRALVHDPRALILDEPTNSLDLHSVFKFNMLLRKIVASGVSIFLVTQNLYDIIPEINRVILMKKGRFIQDGPKGRILNSKNISSLFSAPVELMKKRGYYYVIRK